MIADVKERSNKNCIWINIGERVWKFQTCGWAFFIADFYVYGVMEVS